jgi:acyl-coenzyme A thioesterase PaaI-like protein
MMRRESAATDCGGDGIDLISAEPGRKIFTRGPDESMDNTSDTIHGGAVATL